MRFAPSGRSLFFFFPLKSDLIVSLYKRFLSRRLVALQVIAQSTRGAMQIREKTVYDAAAVDVAAAAAAASTDASIAAAVRTGSRSSSSTSLASFSSSASSSTETVDDAACLVVDLQGFRVEDRFVPRELGWANQRGESGAFYYRQSRRVAELTLKDRDAVTYASRKIHGLPFCHHPDENARSPKRLTGDLVALCDAARRPDESIHAAVVAYKGGHVERDALRTAGLTHLDLETLGCPKFEDLVPSTRVSVADHRCSFHVDNWDRGRCAIERAAAFWAWLRRDRRRQDENERREDQPEEEEDEEDDGEEDWEKEIEQQKQKRCR